MRPWAVAVFVAMPCFGQDPNRVLDETRSRVVQVTRNLPRFTCIETVDREYFEAPTVGGNVLTAPPARACPALFVEPDGRIPEWTDRLRLEVTVAGQAEIHAWPTASEFDTRPIEEIVEGPMTTGAFGTCLLREDCSSLPFGDRVSGIVVAGGRFGVSRERGSGRGV